MIDEDRCIVAFSKQSSLNLKLWYRLSKRIPKPNTLSIFTLKTKKLREKFNLNRRIYQKLLFTSVKISFTYSLCGHIGLESS